ncbi:MAG: TetR/AcrR family transcriptional regulator [Thermodesulfobacteriota bacterium]
MNGSRPATATTKQNILNAASTVIIRKGFDDSRLNEIAQEAGVTEPTIYLHFKGKESLLFSIAEEHMARYLLFLNEHLQGLSDAHNRLRKLVWAHLRYSDMKRDFMSVVLFDCRNNRNFYQSGAYQLFRKYAGILSSILKDGIEENIFRSDMNIALVRDIIFGAMDYEAIRYFVTKEEPDAVLDQENIMQLLDQMILLRYRTENKSADKRQRILRAAVQSFSEKGYSGVTIAEIARKSDVATGTIYEYFKNKEDLILSVSEEQFKSNLEQLKQTFGGNNSPRKLWLFMQGCFQQYLADPDFIVVFLTTVQYNRRFYQSRAYKIQYKYVVELDKMVETILNETNVRNINIRVFRNMFLGGFTHMALRWFLAGHNRVFDKTREIKEVAGLLSDAVYTGNSQPD